MKKFLSLIVLICLIFSLSACNSETAKYTVGICEFTSHAATSEVISGFCDYLTEKLGDDISFDEQNAANDLGAASLIVNSFVTDNVDLILADNTQSLQIASAITTSIPILGAAITDYSSALDVSPYGINVSGTSDLAPLDLQAKMVTELFPDATNVGLIYCSSEANSLYQVNIVEKALNDNNVSTEKFSFVDANDLVATLTAACKKCDVIYLPTDNTVASCGETVDSVCRSYSVPVIAGEKGICSSCGVATLSIDYYSLGRKTGQMAYKVLVEGESVSDMPIEYEDCTKMYNPELCRALGVEIPSDYVPLG